MKSPVVPIELELLTGLGLSVTALAPAFCGLLRHAVQADWAELAHWQDGQRSWRFSGLCAAAAQHQRMQAALDALHVRGPGPYLAAMPTAFDGRAGTQVISAASPCGQYRLHCVGRWSERSALGRTVAAVAAAAAALASTGVAPAEADKADWPTLPLYEGTVMVGADGRPQAWTQNAGAWLAVLREGLPEAAQSMNDAEHRLQLRLRAAVTGLAHRRLAGPELPPSAARFDTPFGAVQLQPLPLSAPLGDTALPMRCLRDTPLPVAMIEGVARTALSPRQKQVAYLAASGISYPAISLRLGLSRATVVDYMQSVYGKLGVASHEQLAVHLATSARP